MSNFVMIIRLRLRVIRNFEKLYDRSFESVGFRRQRGYQRNNRIGKLQTLFSATYGGANYTLSSLFWQKLHTRYKIASRIYFLKVPR